MRVNADKSSILSISRKKDKNIIYFSYKLGDATISRVSTVSCLGVILDSKWSWDAQISQVTKKASKILRFSSRVLHDASSEARLMAFKVLIRPILEYAAGVWDPHSSSLSKRVEAIQRRAARVITHEYSRYTSVTDLLATLKLQTLKERRFQHRLHLFYNIRSGLTILNSINLLKRPDFIGKNDHQCKVKLIAASRNYARFSFFHDTIFNWNALDAATVEKDTLESFKTALGNHRKALSLPKLSS